MLNFPTHINPHASDAKSYGVRKLKDTYKSIDLSEFPNFHKSGSIKGMKKLYYGKGALLIKHGSYIYNVTHKPAIYFECGE